MIPDEAKVGAARSRMGAVRSRRWERRIFWGMAVLLLLVGSAVYGFFVRSRHLFPYTMVKHAGRALRPRHLPGGTHDRRVASSGASSPSIEATRRLANLPYLNGYSPPTVGGVIRTYDRAHSEDGLNFFTSSHAPTATLMDMDGRVVMTWTADAQKALPGTRLDPRHRGHTRFLRDAELLPDGGIVAMFDELGLVRLDLSSRMVWSWRGAVHHDLFVDPRGHIWSIGHERRVTPRLSEGRPILDDFVVELSADGKLLRQISVLDCFQRSRYATMLSNIPSETDDIFHSNSIVVLDGDAPGSLPAFRRGNLVVSVKQLNAVVVIDPDAREVVWELTGQWFGQHSAHVLPSGHLLLFDNLGSLWRASRVLELDPYSQRLLWSFGARPGEDILSETVGFVDRLRNGNTLITESNYGRVLEITPDHHVVWEFSNPNRVGGRKDLIAIVYFMERVPRDLPFLSRSTAPIPNSRHAS